MNDATLTTLWLGDVRRVEFVAAADVLDRRSRVIHAATVTEALRRDESCDVGLIVAAEASPDRFGATSFDALRRRWPATPIVRIAGPWCDGELRSRTPPPGWNLPWLEAASRFERDFDALSRGDCPSWGDPLTLSDEDRILQRVPPGRSPTKHSFHLGVASHDPALATWLKDGLAVHFAEVVRLSDDATADDSIDVVLWESTSPVVATLELDSLRKHCPRARVVALVGFARPEEVERLRNLGVAAIVDLPLILDDLEAAISRLAASPPLA